MSNFLRMDDDKEVNLLFSIGNQTDNVGILQMVRGKAGLEITSYKDRTDLELRKNGAVGTKLTAPN